MSFSLATVTDLRGWLRMIINKCVLESLRLIRAYPRLTKPNLPTAKLRIIGYLRALRVLSG